jgi:hypothetical protein
MSKPRCLSPSTTKDEFSLIILPDTHRYFLYFSEILFSQTDWIREQHGQIGGLLAPLENLVSRITGAPQKRWGDI